MAGVSAAALTALAGLFAAGAGGTVEVPERAPAWTDLVGTFAGSTVLPLATIAAAALFAAAGRVVEARLLLLAVAGAGLLTYALKAALQGLGVDHDGGRIADFPSGHAAVAAALAGALGALAWRAVRGAALRAAVVASLAAGAGAVAWSRVEAGAHTLLSVAGGVALGVGWTAVCVLLWGPGREERAARRAALAAALTGSAAGVALLAVGYGALAPEDAEVAERIDDRAGAGLRRAAEAADTLGEPAVLAVLLLAGLVLLVWRRRWGAVLLLAAGGAGAALLVPALRLLYEPERGGAGLPPASRFPSEAAAAATAVYGALGLVAAQALRRPGHRALAAGAGLLLGGAVAVSRLVLGTAAATEVLAGCLLAGAWLAACLSVGEWRWRR